MRSPLICAIAAIHCGVAPAGELLGPAAAGVDAEAEREDASRRDTGLADAPRPDVPGRPEVGPRDGGRRDASSPDVLRPDTGIRDTGPRDRGPRDLGITDGCVPQLEIVPTSSVVFPRTLQTRTVVLRNVGCDALNIFGANITGDLASIDDFTMTELTATELCNPPRFLCTASDTLIRVTYENLDESAVDQVQLEVTSDDPFEPTKSILLEGHGGRCRPPTSSFVIGPRAPDGSLPLDASASTPGGTGPGSRIIAYVWYIVGPSGAIFSPPTGVMTHMIGTPGVYMVGLRVQNDCGEVSQPDWMMTLTL